MTSGSDTNNPILGPGQQGISANSRDREGVNNSDTALPSGLELVRTTPTFTETTAPAALLAVHKTTADVWGRLVVHSGELDFTFEDQLDQVHHLTAGEHIVIAPQRPHHLAVLWPSTFAVEFYRQSTAPKSHHQTSDTEPRP